MSASSDNSNKCSCVKLRFSRRAHTAVLFIIQLVICCRNISRLLRKLIALPEICRECSLCQDRSRSNSPPRKPCQKKSQACILCDRSSWFYSSGFSHVRRVCVVGLELVLGLTVGTPKATACRKTSP